jgi:hypothetical protein
VNTFSLKKFVPMVQYAMAFFFSASIAMANATTIECKGCDAGYREALAQTAGDGVHYVVDTSVNVVEKFFVETKCEYDRESHTRICTSDVVASEPEAIVASYVREAHFAMKDNITLNANGGGGLPYGVYEDMTNPSRHSFFIEYVAQTWEARAVRLNDYLRQISGAIPPLSFSPHDVASVLTVVFVDGSQAIYRVDRNLGRWERVPGTERDSQGNVVVANAGDFTLDGGGELVFEFTTDTEGLGSWQRDLQHFLDTAAMLGIPVTGAPTRRLVCISVAGEPPVCRYI